MCELLFFICSESVLALTITHISQGKSSLIDLFRIYINSWCQCQETVHPLASKVDYNRDYENKQQSGSTVLLAAMRRGTSSSVLKIRDQITWHQITWHHEAALRSGKSYVIQLLVVPSHPGKIKTLNSTQPHPAFTQNSFIRKTLV